MASLPTFASLGTQKGSIDVRLSYKIIELFSEGLYASPNKAVEELVSNAFDAGAQHVALVISPNLYDQNASIVVIDDGEGMDASGLKQHWLIGISNKRRLTRLPRRRQQIGKFGIGKLATYVLADRLTHVTKRGSKYYSTSMDFSAIDKRVDREVEPKTPIKIPLRELREEEAKAALEPWINSPAFTSGGMRLFGKGARTSWTVAIMSALKEKAHEIRPGVLEWVLRTAMPLRPDFEIWLNGALLSPSKQGKGLLKTWVLGKDITELPKPGPKEATVSEDTRVPADSPERFGLNIPGLGRITGFAEAYRDLLTTGKSEELGRSHGFFVYVFDRLVNVTDGHFGISPDELRHGTFGRFRLVVHIDGLDQELRSNREAISEGPLLSTAQNVLRAIFNAVRPTIEKHDEDEESGAKLSRKLAASPASLSRRPILELARAVVEGVAQSRYLIIPELAAASDQTAFLNSLDLRVTKAENFVAGVKLDYDSSPEAGIVQFDTSTGQLRINAWHPFVATFYEDFANKTGGQPLELLAMAEVLAEAQLFAMGLKQDQIDAFLSARDQLLRHLATSSGRQGAFAAALALQDARNDPNALEDKLCGAFTSLGYEVTPIGGKGEPDGVATALLPADKKGIPGQYLVSLDAKSKVSDKGAVAAGTVKVSAIVRHRDKYGAHHALVVGRAFPTSKGDASALAKEIDDDRKKTKALGEPKTITLITIDALATLVRLRPLKRIGLRKLRELFEECRLPEESAKWVEDISKLAVTKIPYKEIISTIGELQKKRKLTTVKYAALANELSHLNPPINYAKDDELIDICSALAQIAPGGIYAGSDSVELDQSPANIIATIASAMREGSEDSLHSPSSSKTPTHKRRR